MGFDQGLPVPLEFAVFAIGWIYTYTTKCRLNCRMLLGLIAVGEVVLPMRPSSPPNGCPLLYRDTARSKPRRKRLGDNGPLAITWQRGVYASRVLRLARVPIA